MSNSPYLKFLCGKKNFMLETLKLHENNKNH